MGRLLSLAGNRMPSGLGRVRLVGALLIDDRVGDGAQMVCHAHEVIDAVVDSDLGLAIGQHDAGVINTIVVSGGANGQFALGRYLDPVHGRTVATFARRVSGEAA